ncbi:cardiolipin synthase [Romboutsia maritimum]|uniref:Cardiolipin synthase n=1 Tax=Romboutsia maritimum TaxID=2020948 RepID=A0A371IRI3_9FIRM|nr:cardiolipin synthase [Romboutsia maritimum]RDY23085.1 cardiolipin synthase [Romboutsia maritimum]
MLYISLFKASIYEILGTSIYLINFLVILNLIFREKRSIDTTVAWIIILSTFPGIGFFMYIAFGRSIAKDNMFKLKEKEDKVIKDNILYTHSKLSYDSNDENIIKNRDMIYALANSNNATYTTNNGVSIYPKSLDFFNSLLDELKKAKHYINIQFYIFKDDEIGNEILDILIDRAQNGIEVRLLFDAVGSRLLSDKTILKLKRAGVKTGSFFPSFLKIINFNLNYRNHRKIVVIDGKVGFVGGNNVGDEYLGKNPKFGEWRDTHLKLTGDCVKDLNIRFILDWRYTTKEDLDLDKYFKFKYSSNNHIIINNKKNIGIQIVSSGPDIVELDEIKYGYIKMIQRAKKYIYIQTPYLILDRTLLDTLKISALSGVDVKIMIPSKPDHPFVYWASYSYAGELLKFGAKLYTYGDDAFLHAKTIVVDDSICSIGTANMDIRSFELNFEVNAFIYSNEVSTEQRLIFENDILNSTEITLNMYNSRSRYTRIKESISRLLSPIL